MCGLVCDGFNGDWFAPVENVNDAVGGHQIVNEEEGEFRHEINGGAVLHEQVVDGSVIFALDDFVEDVANCLQCLWVVLVSGDHVVVQRFVLGEDVQGSHAEVRQLQEMRDVRWLRRASEEVVGHGARGKK